MLSHRQVSTCCHNTRLHHVCVHECNLQADLHMAECSLWIELSDVREKTFFFLVFVFFLSLEKACQKLQGIPEVPPQRITDLDNATRQLHQLSCILDSCTITASYEVSQAQKALLLLPRTEKGSSTSSEEHYANLPELTHEDVLQEH